jgi:hypothetical protein
LDTTVTTPGCHFRAGRIALLIQRRGAPAYVKRGGTISSAISEFGLWHLAISVALIVIAVAVWKLPDRVRGKLPEPTDLTELNESLTQIEAAADRARYRVGRLDRRLEADAATDYRRSVVLTLIGTLVGLLGGYSASWVDQGGPLFPDGALGRLSIFTAGALLFVLIAPVCIFPSVDRALIGLSGIRARRRA